jgi:hypothetical protein
MKADTPLTRAAQRQQSARRILARLQLLERWRAFGRPVLVGAVAYGLVVAPDIDLEIYCPAPKIEDGFEVLRACALDPQVRKARFANELHGPDQGLYWQLRYLAEDGVEWKVDMWSLADAHPGPNAAALAAPLQRALTAETRLAILEIKEAAQLDPGWQCGSIHIYRAVLDDGVRSVAQFKAWLGQHSTQGLSDWKPRLRGAGKSNSR